MKIKWKTLIFCILIPLAVGGLSALLTMEGTRSFALLEKPPLSPPAWLFPVVWTVLYILMGIASYLVIHSRAGQEQEGRAIALYAVQLFFNFFWSIIFFNLQWYGIAFLWLVILFVLVVLTTVEFFKINRIAGILMLPYCVWVAFAGYLNLAIAFLN